MGVQVVQDQHDALGRRIVHIDQVLDDVGEVAPGALVRDPHLPPASQWFRGEEQVGDYRILCEIGRGRKRLEATLPQLPLLWLETEDSVDEVFWIAAADLLFGN